MFPLYSVAQFAFAMVLVLSMVAIFWDRQQLALRRF
jgi:hypothetical protein